MPDIAELTVEELDAAERKPETVDFAGETFEIADRIALMALMRFAVIAKRGVDSQTLEGLAAMHELLRQCIADHEWDRFEEAAVRERIQDEDVFLDVVKAVFEKLSERPTGRPSDSSDGPQTTPQRSTTDSSVRVIGRLERRGRPDLALFVQDAAAAKTG